jgi:hypothetical protein
MSHSYMALQNQAESDTPFRCSVDRYGGFLGFACSTQRDREIDIPHRCLPEIIRDVLQSAHSGTFGMPHGH